MGQDGERDNQFLNNSRLIKIRTGGVRLGDMKNGAGSKQK